MVQELSALKLDLSYPTEKDDYRFVAFHRHFKSLRIAIEQVHGVDDTFESIVSTSRGLISNNRRELPMLDPDSVTAIQKALRSAWSAEIALSHDFSKDDCGLLSCLNSVLVGQLYFIVHDLLEALVVARKLQPAKSHAGTIKQINQQVQGMSLFPAPWNSLCHGTKSSFSFSGFTDTDTHIKTKVHTEIVLGEGADRMRRVLSTTRKSQYEHQKKRGTAVGPITSFLDFLYRLRLREDYGDSDSFVVSRTAYYQAHSFSLNMRFCLEATMLMVETLLCLSIGEPTMLSTAEAFQRRGGSRANDRIGRRLACIVGARA